MNTTKTITDAIKDASKAKTKGYDTTATVKRIEGSTVWVHIPGGVDETPVKRTINAKIGDVVQVRVSAGSAWLVGNASSPPTDDYVANIARNSAEIAQVSAENAQSLADDAFGRAKEAGLLANSAYELAGRAKTTADGKNAIYRQASMPTGGEYVSGDVWFDSDDDNKIYRYNGASWIAVALGDDAIDSLSANKLTAGTIDASVITVSNLDAGNITTGHLDADILIATDLSAYDLSAWSATIGGFHIGADNLFSPPSAFIWDCTTTVSERATLNSLLGLSESTSSWTYDDLTSAEMSTLNTLLGLSESTSSWSYSVTVSEYKTICKAADIAYKFGRSVYLGNDAISLGDDFFVNEDGYMMATAGKIGDLDIVDGGLEYGLPSDSNYMKLAGSSGLQLGQYFDVTTTGVVNMRRGIFGGFEIVPATDGNDYLVSDYSVGNIDYRTWIRSADSTDGNNTWIYSAQIKKASEERYSGAFLVTAGGHLYCHPYDSNGDANGGLLKVDTTGIYTYLGNGTSTSSQPNLRLDPSTYYLKYSTWTSSSEKIKKQINDIVDCRLDPENLYDVNIIQFKYKDEILEENDQRYDSDLIGFLIEDLNEKYPVVVDRPSDDPKTWNWNSAYLIPAMMKLIQNQHKDIEQLKLQLKSN